MGRGGAGELEFLATNAWWTANAGNNGKLVWNLTFSKKDKLIFKKIINMKIFACGTIETKFTA